MRRARRQLELDDELALGERGAAGADRRCSRPARCALPLRADDDGRWRRRRSSPARCRRRARRCTGCRRASAALDLRPSRSGPCASTTPGQAAFSAACASIIAPGVAAPMTKPPPSCADADDAGDVLGVDDQLGLQPAGAQLHQQIGAARPAAWRGRRRRPTVDGLLGPSSVRHNSNLACSLLDCARQRAAVALRPRAGRVCPFYCRGDGGGQGAGAARPDMSGVGAATRCVARTNSPVSPSRWARPGLATGLRRRAQRVDPRPERFLMTLP